MQILAKFKRLEATCCAVLCLGLLLAQQSAVAAEEPQRPIEEIEVIGERSLISLEHEIRETEVQMYELFNDLNSTDDFDVTCRNVIHTGTLIPTWECDAGFMTRERFQNVQDFLQSGFIPRTDEQMYWENRHKVAALNAEMLALAKENPALARAMLDLHAKRQRMEELQRQKRENTGGFFRRLFGREED